MIRLSRDSDESTSPERQREHIERWAAAYGHTIVGWAEDVGVSASVSPFKREKLGPWLTDPLKMTTYDGLAAYKLDRLSRRLFHTTDLMKWALDHGKDILCVENGFDLNSAMGRMMVTILSVIAEGELEAIKERTTDSHAKLRKLGRWTGGTPPFGYRPVKNPDGEGHVLELHPDTAPVAREIIKRAIDGESMNSICVDLNKRGIKSPRGRLWQTQTLHEFLRSRRLLGQGTTRGKKGENRTPEVKRGADGLPLQYGPALVEKDDWKRLQVALDKRAKSKSWSRRGKPGLLTDIAHCAKCGKKLYIKRRSDRPEHPGYYRCMSPECTSVSFRADHLNALGSYGAMLALWRIPETERVFIPGVDHTADIEEAEEALRDTIERSAGKTGRARAIWDEQIASLEARLSHLESLPTETARYEYVSTGRTYGDAWATSADERTRGDLLRTTGLKIDVSADGSTRWAWPDDLAAQMEEGNRPRRAVDIARIAERSITGRILMRGNTIEATTMDLGEAVDLLRTMFAGAAEATGDSGLLALVDIPA